jgi:hypothetical protein
MKIGLGIGLINKSTSGGAIHPFNTVAPVISGSTSLGSTLTSTTGTWSGTAPITYSYQWKRGATNIGTNSSTYVTVAGDSLANITCVVTATNSAGSSNATSNTLTMANYTPANTVAPAVSGTAVVGQVLTTTNGTWTNSPSSYSYQWKRGATNIGTNSNSYTLVSADAGQSITCVVTATNAGGSANATSNTLAILTTVLDLYPTASAAYSLRLLRGAFYTSNAIRVRRSSDNTEQDIGFTTTGNLNTTALTSFVGANNGFIVTWYDQSGNAANATQTTQANQPQIVSAGSILLQGANPTVLFNGTSNFMDAAGVTTGNPKSIFVSTKNNYIGILEKVLFDSTATNQALLYKDPSNFISIGFGTFTATTYTATTNFILYSVLHNGASSNMYVNSANQILTNQNLGTNAFAGLRIGAVRGTASLHYSGNISEFIVYGSNQATNRTAIETNINNYYNIYPVVSDPDAQAFVSAAELTSQTQANAINTLVIGMKAQGLWTKMKAVYPMVGGTATSHMYNLKDPRNLNAAFRLSFSGTWTHDSSGAEPNGVNGYADTYLNTSTNLVRTNAHLALYVVNNPTVGAKYDIGNASNAAMTVDPTYLITRYNSNLVFVGIGDNSYATSSTTTDSRAFWLGGTNGSSTQIIYKNGVSIASASQGAGALSNINLYIGAANAGGITSFYSDKKYAFGSIGTGLSATDATNYYNLVQAFQTTLGRQINP